MSGSETRGVRAELAAQVGRLSLEVAFDSGPGTLVLLGPNGAGKTTLLSLLLGVLRPGHGRIAVGDAVLYDSTERIDVPVESRRLGYVPQDYALFPHLTVRENIAFAWRSAAARGAPHAQAKADEARAVESALEGLGIRALSDRRPDTLSGGEQQRVALARAISVSPRALLLDEPLAALDVHARGEVREFFAGTLERLAIPSIVITHDPADARLLGQRVLVLEAGRVTQSGTWDELVRAPATDFVRRFAAG